MTTRPVSRPPRPARRTGLRIEPLEDRAVPAASLNFDDRVDGVAADAAGNLYVDYGTTHGTVDLDPGPGTRYVTGTDFGTFQDDAGRYLVKYSPARDVLWVKAAADLPARTRGWNLTVAPDGAGGQALYTFGGTVTKLDLDGNVLWSKDTETVSSAFVDADGSVYITGSFQSAADLDPGTAWADGRDLVSAPSQGVYLAKWDPAGTLLWSRAVGSTPDGTVSPDVWAGGVTAADGVVYLSGFYRGTLSLGLTNDAIDPASVTTGNYSPDGFLAAYDTAGTYQSAAHFVDARPIDLAAAGGAVYAGFSFWFTADLDPGPGQRLLDPGTKNGDNLAVARFGYSGPGGAWTLAWADPFVSTLNSLPGSVQVVGNDLYVSGVFGATTDFDPGPGTYNRTAGGGQDAFALRLDAGTGGLGWVTQIGSTRALAVSPVQESVELIVLPTGIYLGGRVAHGSIDVRDPFGLVAGAVQAGLDTDGFVGELGLDGRYQWGFTVGAPGRTIDDGDPDYAETGSGWKAASVGYQGDSRTHAKAAGAERATWSAAGLPNGVYRVATRYPAAAKNASAAPFRLNGGPAVAVNERVAPNDWYFQYLDGTWEDLGTVAVTNGTLSVQLSDAANGQVVADAVRCWFVGAPLAAAGGPATGSSEKSLTTAALRPIVAEAVRRWNATGLTAAERSLLRHVHFEIADLDGATLGLASGHTVTLDRDAAGYGWFVDRTAHRDTEFTTAGDQGEQNHMDLLTVVMHELGHILGRDHAPDGLMAETLTTGTRLSPVDL